MPAYKSHEALAACDLGTHSPPPSEDATQNVVAKLQGYFDWAKADKRIAGFNPWHWETRQGAQSGPPCDMILGAKTMPAVVAELTKIGQYILAQ